MFLSLILFWSDVYKANKNLDSVQFCFASKFIANSLSCFCVNGLIQNLEWDTGVLENVLTSTLNQEEHETGACLLLWIEQHHSDFHYENGHLLNGLSIFSESEHERQIAIAFPIAINAH